MIEDVARSAETVAADPGHADSSEPINQNARLTLFVVKADSSVHEFGIAFEHIGANTGGRSGRAKKKNPAETNRQFELRTARFDRGTTSGKYVQRTIEEDRVQRIFARPFRCGFGERHAPGRNTLTD